ncbi:MAG: hypothetical protein ACRDGM_00805 [bacterium]
MALPASASPDSMLGIAVEQSAALLLLARIRRNNSGIFVLPPHDSDGTRLDNNQAWNPHASYHASGQRHVKSFNGLVFAPEKRTPLDENFSGCEHVFDLGLKPGDWAKSPVIADLSSYVDLFRISASELNLADSYVVSVCLIAPDDIPSYAPYGAVLIAEQSFRDWKPWIHVWLGRVEVPSTPK